MIPTKPGEPFVFVIPTPRIRQVVSLATAAFFLSMLGYFFWKFGLDRLQEDLTDDPTYWWLVLLMALFFLAPTFLFLYLAFPPQGLLQKLQFRKEGIRFIPDGLTRRLLGEPDIEIGIGPKSQEILVCHGNATGLPDGYGYQIIVRAADGSEHAVKAGYLTLRNRPQVQRLSEGITAVTGLPVRIVNRRRLPDRTIMETPWALTPFTAKLRILASLASGIMPFLGGATVGCLQLQPAFIPLIGLALWMVQSLGLFLLSASNAKRPSFALPRLLTTLFTFAASFSLAVVMAAYLFRRH
jgi:hypothetical protein